MRTNPPENGDWADNYQSIIGPMKNILLAAAALALIGAGCVAVEDAYETKPAKPAEQVKDVVKDEPIVGSGVMNIIVPSESELLPTKESWNPVAIKNLGRPYSVEIHPWWHWDATTDSLKNEGALFANSQPLLFGGSAQGEQYRVSIKGMKIENATSLKTAVEASMINECDIFEGKIEGWDVCMGRTESGLTRGLALRNDGSYEWKAQLLAAQPAEKGAGYFVHLLESFKEETEN